MKVLLDTNAYGGFRRAHPKIVELVRDAEEVLMSVVVAGELLDGFRSGNRYERNEAELRSFLELGRVRLLPVAYETADRYGRIKSALRRKGRPIPTNDIWIAAHAMETGATLVSRDDHFGQVDGLAWVNPGA